MIDSETKSADGVNSEAAEIKRPDCAPTQPGPTSCSFTEEKESLEIIGAFLGASQLVSHHHHHHYDPIAMLERIVELEAKLEVWEGAVVQVNHRNGYYSLHRAILQREGHIGHTGPIIHAGEQIKDLSVG